jgi:hypothetical protein
MLTKSQITDILVASGIERCGRNEQDTERCKMALEANGCSLRWGRDFILGIIDDYVWGF